MKPERLNWTLTLCPGSPFICVERLPAILELTPFRPATANGTKFFLPDSLPPVRDVSLISNHAVLEFQTPPASRSRKRLVRHLHEFVEIERPIVECAGQTKAVIHKHSLARTIALVHPSDLWMVACVSSITTRKSCGKKSMIVYGCEPGDRPVKWRE